MKPVRCLLLTLLFGAPLILVGLEWTVDPDPSRYFREILRVQQDLFTAGKVVWVVGLSILLFAALLFITAHCWWQNKWIKGMTLRAMPHPGMLFGSLYFLWIVVCQLCSPFPEVSWLGFPEHYDGTLTHLAYGVIFTAAARIAYLKGKIRGLTGVLIASSALVMTVGWMQYFGHSVWDWSVFRQLFDPLWEQGVHITSKWGAGAWTSTLNAENWAGAWLALHVPFAAALILAPSEPKTLTPMGLLLLWYGALCLSLAANGTRSALVGSLFGLGVALAGTFALALHHSRHKEISQLAVKGLLLLLVFFLATHWVPTKGVTPSARLADAAALTVSHLEETVTSIQDVSPHDTSETKSADEAERTHRYGKAPQGFQPADLGIRLESRGHALLISGAGSASANLTFLPAAAPQGLSLAVWRRQGDQSWAVPIHTIQGEGFRLRDPDLQDVLFAPTEVPYVYSLHLQGLDLRLFISGSEVGIWQWRRPVRAEVPPVAWHALPDNFANMRGYVWKRSIPLVFKHPLFGTGAGSFPEAFPQADFSGKIKFFGMPHIIVEKPHSLYLGNLIYFGWPGLIFFLGLLVSVGTQVWVAARKHPPTNQTVAAFSGTAALLCCGAFVDSFVGFSSLFWALFGLCFGSSLRKPA
jgi:hypothetical protein